MAVDQFDVIALDGRDTKVSEWLQHLLQDRSATCPASSDFKKRASDVLRTELAALPPAQQRQLPTFGSSLSTFYDAYTQQSYQLESINFSMLCFGQLAHWIRLQEEMPGTLNKAKLVVGDDIGLLAACAISTYTSISTFLTTALAFVKLAFHVGLAVDLAACRLNIDRDGVWSKKISLNGKADLQKLLDLENNDSIRHSTNQCYISCEKFSYAIVSGAPNALAELFSQQCIKDCFVENLETRGLLHAPHVYTSDDVESCISCLGEYLHTLVAVSPLLSGSNGNEQSSEERTSLVDQAVRDILCRPSKTEVLIRKIQQISQDASLRLIPIGPCSSIQNLASGLSEHGAFDISVLETSYESMQSLNSSAASSYSGKIAIVGMSGRFPGGQDTTEFWNMLLQGLDMHMEIPPDRFDAQAHFDPSGKGKNKSHTPFGCFIKDAGLFDPRFFNMSPREAMQTDPMQRLAILTAWEALEMSGYAADRTASTKLDRIGTFYGQTSDDWREINEAQDIDTYFITGGVRAFGPGRINYFFKFSGPSYSIDTACSSSMAALQLACTSLKAKECDTAITGGLNILTNPDIFAGLSKGQFLSKNGNCQTFDDDADGYCRGDGIGTVILKRLEDAIADKDNILGTILATATNHSSQAVSITHPHAETQEKLYHHILDQAGVDPLDVGYVEMHGTGTQAGDATEMTSVLNIFAPKTKTRMPDQPLYLGSVKSNIGHGEAASGVCALIKVLLMFKNNAIPPHCGIKGRINHTFPKDMLARNIIIPTATSPFVGHGKKRTVYISNFSAAGGNSGMILQENTSKPIKNEDPRQTHVVAVSARALSSLHSNLRNLADHIESNPDLCLSNLGYTSTARRAHHNYKIAFTASSLPKLRAELLGVSEQPIEPTAAAPNIIFSFTGQGSHYLNIAGELFATSNKFKSEVLHLNSIALALGFPSFLPLISGARQELESMSAVLIQVGLVSIQISLCELWSSWDIRPDLVVGHSLGEYAALYAAGVLSASEVIHLVGVRAILLEKNCQSGTHSMLAVNTNHRDLDKFLRSHPLEVACINGPSETVLSGRDEDIEIAKELLLSAAGTKCRKLNVSYAFHSTQVDNILPEFKAFSSRFTCRKPKIPVLSPLLGSVLQTELSPDYLCSHARKTVNFLGALKAGQSQGLIKPNSIFIEIGPRPVTLNFVRSTLGLKIPGTACLDQKESNWSTISKAASLLYNHGARINWNEYHKQFEKHLTLLDLPMYSWAMKNYWIDYKGNWCLNKGDDLAIAPREPTLSTTTVQNIVKESYTQNEGFMTVESDIHRPDMFAAISGHKVNGAALCPSSLLGDIAVTVATHMYNKLWRESLEHDGRILNVKDMEVSKPLIAKPGTQQILRIEATANKQAKYVNLSFYMETIEHAHCSVAFEDKEEQQLKWSRSSYLVLDRLKSLRAEAAAGEAHIILSSIAYQLFASLVDYEAPYRGMKRVFFNATNFEATAEISLYRCKTDETFSCAPYWLDSIGHLAGFCVNAKTTDESQDNVYISHGWESLRLSEKLVPEKAYTTYVRMLSGGGQIMVGDVYLFDQEKIIGLFGGLKFQRIPRRVLDIMLPPADGHKRPISNAVETAGPVAMLDKAVADLSSGSNGQKPAILQKVWAIASVTSQVLDIVARECGVALAELADSNQFSDLGVDSLMQLAISGRIREDVGLDIHSTLFVDYPTILALKDFLAQFENHEGDGEADESSNDGRRSASEPSSETSTAATPTSEKDSLESQQESLIKDVVKSLPSVKEVSKTYAAQSFILSGSKLASRYLFMIPDGGGAAISYTHIPTLAKDVCVFGLNSPFMFNPEDYDCGVSGIAAMFVAEIRRRQPHGPYDLGGWSAGGVIAYECAQQLIKAGQEVAHLVLLDSPCPLIIEALPNTLHAWFSSIGLIGDPNNPGSTKIPAWLLPHFSSTIQALSSYNARKLMLYDTGLPIPKTTAIWCQEGICHDPDSPKPDPYPYGHAQWLLEDHDDFGDGGWDALLGKGVVEGRIVPGNHFTMMKDDNVEALTFEIRRALEIGV